MANQKPTRKRRSISVVAGGIAETKFQPQARFSNSSRKTDPNIKYNREKNAFIHGFLNNFVNSGAHLSRTTLVKSYISHTLSLRTRLSSELASSSDERLTSVQTFPPIWRYLNENNRAIMFSAILHEQAGADPMTRLVPISFDLSQDLFERAVDSHGNHAEAFLPFIADQLNKQFQRYLHRQPEYWMAVDIAGMKTGKGRVHVHGHFIFHVDELKKRIRFKLANGTATRTTLAYAGFHAANREYSNPDFIHKAVKRGHKTTLAGWADYATKLRVFAHNHVLGSPVLYCTAHTKRAGKALYEHIRSEIVDSVGS